MKKLVFLLFAALSLTACEKDADTDKLDNEYLVFTSHDAATKFNSFTTYYMPDSILLIGDSKKSECLKDDNAKLLVSAFIAEMDGHGYLRTTDKSKADLGVMMSYVKSTYYIDNYYGNGPWWGNYPGYWYPGYWGGNWGGGWCYPFPVTYSFNTGSLLTDLVNLKDAPADSEKSQLTVVWNTCISGLIGGGGFNVNQATRAIQQAFQQSPYLKK